MPSENNLYVWLIPALEENIRQLRAENAKIRLIRLHRCPIFNSRPNFAEESCLLKKIRYSSGFDKGASHIGKSVTRRP